MKRTRKAKRPIQITRQDGTVIASFTGRTVAEAAIKRDALLRSVLVESMTATVLPYAVITPYVSDGDDPTLTWGYVLLDADRRLMTGEGSLSRDDAIDRAWHHAQQVIIDRFLGAPDADRATPEFWANAIARTMAVMQTPFAGLTRAQQAELVTYYAWQCQYVRAREANPSGDTNRWHHAASEADKRDVECAIRTALEAKAA